MRPIRPTQFARIDPKDFPRKTVSDQIKSVLRPGDRASRATIALNSRNAASLLVRKNGLSIAAGVNDPKNSYLSRLYAVEDQMVVDGKGTNVGAQVRFEAFADVGELGKHPERVCN